MVWVFVVAALTVLYLALRFRRFQSWVEPVLTIAFAIGLVVALVIWLAEGRNPVSSDAPIGAQPAEIDAGDIQLSRLQFTPGQPATSYRVTGRISNASTVTLQSFRLTITLKDCPNGTCRVVGEDSALIIARVPPATMLPFTTFAVFPNSDIPPMTAPEWSWSVTNIRAYDR